MAMPRFMMADAGRPPIASPSKMIASRGAGSRPVTALRNVDLAGAVRANDRQGLPPGYRQADPEQRLKIPVTRAQSSRLEQRCAGIYTGEPR